MSFLYRSSVFAVRAAARPSPRLFSTTIRVQKDAVDVGKDTLKAADRTVSDKLVSGIEAGQQAAAKAREVAGMSSSEAQGKANEVMGEAKGKANEIGGKASELSGEAKGKANEMAGEAKGKKEEMKGEAKSKMN